MKFHNLEISVPADGVALIRLAGLSGRANNLGTSFLRELHTAVEYFREGNRIKFLVFTGKERIFSSGADLSEMQNFGPAEITRFLNAGQSLIRSIMDLDIITIAAVNGIALGGGLELTLACDMRWAHRRAVFGLPEAKLGLLPGWGGIPLLRLLVPESFCREMIEKGDFVSARGAFEAGLVSRLFDGMDFVDGVLAEVERMAAEGKKVPDEIKARVRLNRGIVDLASFDDAFLQLWNERFSFGR